MTYAETSKPLDTGPQANVTVRRCKARDLRVGDVVLRTHLAPRNDSFGHLTVSRIREAPPSQWKYHLMVNFDGNPKKVAYYTEQMELLVVVWNTPPPRRRFRR
jgi:hypothetical protein